MKEDEGKLLICKPRVVTDSLFHCNFGGGLCYFTMQRVCASVVLLTFLLTHHSPFFTDCGLGRKNGKSSLSLSLTIFRSSFIHFLLYSGELPGMTKACTTACHWAVWLCLYKGWSVRKSFRCKFKATFSNLLYQR